MRDVFVHLQLDHLRIDHQHPQLLRQRFVEQRHDHGVEADRLSCAGAPATSRCGIRARSVTTASPWMSLPNARVSTTLLGEGVGVDDVAQCDQLARFVRHFDADGRRAADALDADRLRLQRQRQIVAEVDDFGVLHAGGRLELERGDDRAGVIRGHFAVDGELAAALFDEMPDVEELLVDVVVDRVHASVRR